MRKLISKSDYIDLIERLSSTYTSLSDLLYISDTYYNYDDGHLYEATKQILIDDLELEKRISDAEVIIKLIKKIKKIDFEKNRHLYGKELDPNTAE